MPSQKSRILPHLKIDQSLVGPFVLLPGDPGRVSIIGTKLKDFKILGTNREFVTGKGIFGEIPIMICSTGIGGPSTAIAVEELIAAGAKVLIRVGTCGGAWRSDIPLGSLVIPTASVRDEGTTLEYMPQGFPAVADFEIVGALKKAAKQLGIRGYLGINRTHDAFYGNLGSTIRWGTYLNDEKWKKNDTPILSSEMESAPLFIIASLHGVKAGAVFAVNAHPEPLKERIRGERQRVLAEVSEEATEKVVNAMIMVALKAIEIFTL